MSAYGIAAQPKRVTFYYSPTEAMKEKAKREREEREAAELLRWKEISEDAAEGFFQALDAFVSRSAKLGIKPGKYTIAAPGEYNAYYNKLILGRLEKPEDEWRNLPKYKGWRFNPHFGVKVKNGYLWPLAEVGKDDQRHARVWIPPKKLSESGFEIFQTLCNDAQGEFDSVELAQKAELLA